MRRIKHHPMKTQAGVEVQLHAFFTSAQMEDSRDEEYLRILPGVRPCSSSLRKGNFFQLMADLISCSLHPLNSSRYYAYHLLQLSIISSYHTECIYLLRMVCTINSNYFLAKDLTTDLPVGDAMFSVRRQTDF